MVYTQRIMVAMAAMFLVTVPLAAQFSAGVGYEYLGDIYPLLTANQRAPCQSVFIGGGAGWPAGIFDLGIAARLLKAVFAVPLDSNDLPAAGIGVQGNAFAGVWLLGNRAVRPGGSPGVAVAVDAGIFLGLDAIVIPLPWIDFTYGPLVQVQVLWRLVRHLGIVFRGGIQYDMGHWLAKTMAGIDEGIGIVGTPQPFVSAGMFFF